MVVIALFLLYYGVCEHTTAYFRKLKIVICVHLTVLLFNLFKNFKVKFSELIELLPGENTF